MPKLAIVDYQLGNLFSIKHMCEHLGFTVDITHDASVITGADAVILPGVGAFGDAMEHLNRLDLVSVLKDVAASNTPMLGICLGLQLLMTESEEFGLHKGLDIIPGRVTRFPHGIAKVPHVGWNTVNIPAGQPADRWQGTLLEGLEPGVFQYFVHSFYVTPDDPAALLTETTYETTTFCSGVKKGNVTALQFHPERSGEQGMIVYRNLLDGIAGK